MCNRLIKDLTLTAVKLSHSVNKGSFIIFYQQGNIKESLIQLHVKKGRPPTPRCPESRIHNILKNGFKNFEIKIFTNMKPALILINM